VTPADRALVRGLAREVADAAALPVQAERIRLWKALNRLEPGRPMVLLDPQNGWADLVPEAALSCAEPDARAIERRLRQTLFRHHSIPDDHPITADWPVAPVLSSSGWGVADTTERTEARGLRWDPPLKEYADIAKLRPASLGVDREAGADRLAFHRELFGDILAVRPAGVSFFRCGLTRKLIVLRGLERFLFDLHDAPAFVHELMTFLRDEQLRELAFCEREGLLGLNNGPMDLTGSGGIAATDALPAACFDPSRVRSLDLFAWGESQETTGVGPDQFAEFVLPYQLPVLERFGLVDYGCCEPLDSRLALLLASLPRLLWVSVSPWADRALAAELLGDRYVYCWKPQPSLISREHPDWKAAEREIRETLTTARGCPLSIVLKDTTSFFGDPSRATRWASMTRRLAEGAAARS
jgi:hypothetical protein